MRKIYKYDEIVKKGKASENWKDSYDEEDEVEVYLGCMNQIVIGKLNSYGLSWDSEKKEVYVEGEPKEVFAKCWKLFNLIDKEYEVGGSKIWTDELGLGGDDDVDYNSSYPSCVVAVLEEIEK